MNYSNIKNYDISNGTGVRVSLFVSGCRNHCPNCFNQETWDFNYGKPFDEAVQDDIIKQSNNSFIEGLSILGGEPMERENQADILNFITKFKKTFKDKNIWLYTGFTLEELLSGSRASSDLVLPILSNIDVLCDGRFVESLKDISLKFRGSSNQRLIDTKLFIESGIIKEIEI